jgi:DNA polymerase III subunit epsilon
MIPTFMDIIEMENWVVLDTETTGLEWPAEIIQIAIIDHLANTLLDTLVKPMYSIPPDATAIHHIDDETVKFAKPWPYTRDQVHDIVKDRDVIIYNAAFDKQMLRNSHRMYQIDDAPYWFPARDVRCAMLWYADVRSEWDDYRGNNRWHRLSCACDYERVVYTDAHSAIADCRMTYALIRAVQARLKK